MQDTEMEKDPYYEKRAAGDKRSILGVKTFKCLPRTSEIDRETTGS